MALVDDSLNRFHPRVAEWFREDVGLPTGVQRAAWPPIAAGRHCLITAPTGSGKTLAAFLVAIDRFLTGGFAPGATRVLYVSPLRALNYDIQRNLLAPLAQLRRRFEVAGEPFPELRVLTRSGDTPAAERSRLVRHPPEILITTPESLHLLLTSRRGREALRPVQTVILDEIHAVAGTKRGTFLMTGVERLAQLAGEVQRIALSATQRPLERIARFVGGRRNHGTAEAPIYEDRPVDIVDVPGDKAVDLRVVFPIRGPEDVVDSSYWPRLAEDLRERVRERGSTLIFANARRQVEKIALLLNEDEELAFSHHGSLSREVRTAVETRLKRGELPAVVATSSLELGIDIGDLDRVILIQCPNSVSSALQRIGRAGHRVGATSHALLYPTFQQDLLEAAVLVQAVGAREIEETRIPRDCLDVLAQEIVALASLETWRLDELYSFFRCVDAYRDLPRVRFDAVLEMLCGRYAATRLRDLKARVVVDRTKGTVAAAPGAHHVAVLSSGTIPDRGLYALVTADGGTRLGDLDEEFVWENGPGSTFQLGTQFWTVERVDNDKVYARPASRPRGTLPFWHAEAIHRDPALSERLGAFLARVESTFETPEFEMHLREECRFDDNACHELVRYLRAQKQATGELPTGRRLVVEQLTQYGEGPEGSQLVVHSLWGGRVNQPWGLALSEAWRRRTGSALEVAAFDNAFVFQYAHDEPPETLLALATPENVEELLVDRLEGTGLFGARFRENAARALLLPRRGPARRTPLWLNRLRAQNLGRAVRAFPDFPILLETYRDLLQDEFRLDVLREVLTRLHEGEIELRVVQRQRPSPFVDAVLFRLIGGYMYEADKPSGTDRSLDAGLLQDAGLVSAVVAAAEQVRELEDRLQRRGAGYAPESPDEWLAWIRECGGVALSCVDCREELETGGAVLAVQAPGQTEPWAVAVEDLPVLLAAWELPPDAVRLAGPANPRDALPPHVQEAVSTALGTEALRPESPSAAALAVLRNYLSLHGPVSRETLLRDTGLDGRRVDGLLASLREDGEVRIGRFVTGAEEPLLCDARNLEALARLVRRSRRAEVRARPPEQLPLFLAHWQGLGREGDAADLPGVVDRLLGWSAPAAQWETQLLPARLAAYDPAWLDALFQEYPLRWYGTGKERISLGFVEELAEVLPPADDCGAANLPLPAEFERLLALTGLRSTDLSAQLWQLAWEGRIANDTFLALRRGIAQKFAVPAAGSPGARGVRRWAKSRPLAGQWFILPRRPPGDALDELQAADTRLRHLLDRYGIVFRELLAHEAPGYLWRDVFPALRRLELAGEVLPGHFFEGVPGLQFAAPAAVRRHTQPLEEDRVCWLHAQDPASVCGLGLEGFGRDLPSRAAGNHVVYHGTRLVLVSRSQGKAVRLFVPPGTAEIPRYLSLFHAWVNRRVDPLRAVRVETVNGRPAVDSEYLRDFEAAGFTREYAGLELRGRL